MSAELDLDDVAGTSPKARRELDELRARLDALEAQSAEVSDQTIMTPEEYDKGFDKYWEGHSNLSRSDAWYAYEDCIEFSAARVREAVEAERTRLYPIIDGLIDYAIEFWNAHYEKWGDYRKEVRDGVQADIDAAKAAIQRKGE